MNGFLRRSLSWLVITGVLFTLTLAVTAPVAAQQGPTNLLVNGDFEAWDWDNPGWPWQDGIPEVQVVPGWRAYYVDTAPDGVPMPQQWKRPEFRDVKAAEFSYRVHGGLLAQKYFTFGGQHIAGLYQQVGNIAPGTPLRFSIYMHTWSCMTTAEAWNICPTGSKSNSPSPMHTKVGIDPYGGTNPWSPNVVWSSEIDAYDQWTLFQVDAVAQAGTVTVFTYSYADWFDNVFRIHNDVYIDDGSLVALDEAPATATPDATPETPVAPTETPDPNEPTATPAPTHTPAPTPTLRPDGAVVHVVKEGDALNAIAQQYGITPEQIEALNDLDDANVLWVGQELVIALSEPTPAPTPAPTATPDPPTPTVAPTATPVPASPSPTPTLAPTATAQPAAPTTTPEAAARSGNGIGTTILTAVVVLAGGVGLGFYLGRKR